MGWSFRRTKSFGLFKLNFSKSGIGFSFGVPGARVGVNAKGKKYVRGGIPGTGLYYQSSLPDTRRLQPGQARSPRPASRRLAFWLRCLWSAFIIYGMSSSSPDHYVRSCRHGAARVAPVAAPVAPTHAVRKHKRKHAADRIPATATKPDVAPAAESASAEAAIPSS